MEERRKAFRANRKYLGSLLEAQLRGNRMLRVSYKRAIKRMAGDAGTWAGFNFFLPSINIGGPGLGPSIRIVWIGIVLLSVLLRSCS